MLLGSFRRPARPLLLALIATGCFVSKEEIDAFSDKDGDKVPVGTDCDDEDADVTTEIEWYSDVDGDGFGAGEVQSGCPAARPSTNTADNADDCDDSNPSAFPGAEERYYDGVDQDCAGEDADGNGSIDDFDQDADGWEQDQDCDDTDPTLRPDPSLTEVPYDGIDNDCDLTTGDGDKDGDGYWSVDYYAKASGSTLAPPVGFDGDCLDDVDAPEQDASPHNGFDGLAPEDVHPAVTVDAPYDGIDADCGGNAREWDADGDGQASAAYPDRADVAGLDCQDCTTACDGEPDWSSSVDSSDIFHGATDAPYDGVDADCAGVDTNGDTVEDDYDVDLDGYVVTGETDRYGNVGDDCLDLDPDTHPGAADRWYDGVDSDCGGEDDFDADFDGYVANADFGEPTAGIEDWTQLPAGDCLDDDAAYHPGASDDAYDGLDHDCGGEDDYDADADGHRDESFAGATDLATYQATTVVVAHSAAETDDCDDTDAAVSPSAAEVEGNGIDDDCDAAGAPFGIQGTNLPADHHSGAVYWKTVEAYGTAIAAGDLSGDGIPDLAVGTPLHDVTGTHDGGVQWFDGTDLLGSTLTDDEDAGFYTAPGTKGEVGSAVAVADVTGDGFDDLLVSGPSVTWASATGPYDGVVYVLAGPLSGSSTSPVDGDIALVADYTFAGTLGAYLGTSLSVLDEDGDGLADIIAGTPNTSVSATHQGALYIWPGGLRTGTYDDTDATVVYGDASDDRLGSCGPAARGDFDGNGWAELYVGACESDRYFALGGQVQLLETPITSGSTAEDIALTELQPATSYELCGTQVAAGDVDGDGYDDLAMSCVYGSSFRGAVAVVLGEASPSGRRVYTDAEVLVSGTASAVTTELGAQLQLADLTGDGALDLLIGDRLVDTVAGQDAGTVWMFDGVGGMAGTYTTSAADGQVAGDTHDGRLGYALAATSDFDADGVTDLLVSRQLTNIGGFGLGDVLLFTGGEW